MTGCQKNRVDYRWGMESLTPKQREIRDRERRILDVAYPMLREGGFGAVKMERIARAMGLTRGTIYNHFANKEEIVMALATRAVTRRMAMFHYASGLSARPRHACAAIGIAAEVYADHLTEDFQIEQMVRHDVVLSKASPRRQSILQDCERQCLAALRRLIDAAIACGDLEAGSAGTQRKLRDQIAFGLWSLVYGGLVLEATSPSLHEAGIGDPRATIRSNCNALLDRLGWQPRFDARQYSRHVNRVTPLLVDQARKIRDGNVPLHFLSGEETGTPPNTVSEAGA